MAPTRRRFMQHALVGTLASACSAPRKLAADAGQPPLHAPPEGVLDVAGMPYRQDDPGWRSDLMWDRALVIRAATQLNGDTLSEAQALLREFDDGNTVGNEGCMLTCLAMTLRLLVPQHRPPWTPGTLNTAAHEHSFYSPCGLSMTTLYADLVSEVSGGEVQLCLKEEYRPGVRTWPRRHARGAPLLPAYRSLRPVRRAHFVVMLKLGTFDDTVASHYVLSHPHETAPLDEDDLEILDPAMPLTHRGPWRLSDSARTILADAQIAAAWADDGIEPTQLGGVWVFARSGPSHDGVSLSPLVRAWADQLAAGTHHVRQAVVP